MHIAAKGIVRRSIAACYCGVDYAAFTADKMGNLVIARRSDGLTLFVRGDDASNLTRELDKACAAMPDDECEAIDRTLDVYDAIETWDAFEETRCYPSSDLMLLNYY